MMIMKKEKGRRMRKKIKKCEKKLDVGDAR
jgi:phage anti-repressor protein